MIQKYFIPSISDKNATVGSFIIDFIDGIGEVANPPFFAEKNLGDIIKGYDIIELFDDIGDILKKYSDVTNELKDFSYLPHAAYSTLSQDDNNSIRYKIINRTPSTTEQGSREHSGRKDYRWVLTDIVNDVNHPGYKVLIYRKPFDNTIEITSWSRNYRDSNKAAFEIESLIDTYKNLFLSKGLLQIRYKSRKEDVFSEINSQEWYGAPLVYYAKTMKVKAVYEKTLEDIALEITVNN